MSDSVDFSHVPSKPRTSSSVPAGVVQPRVLFTTTEKTPSGDDTTSLDLSFADILSACEELHSTILHSPTLAQIPYQASFVEDFLPLSLTGADIVLQLYTSIGSTTSVVCEMFSLENNHAVPHSDVVPPHASSSDPLCSSVISPALGPRAPSSTSPSLADHRNSPTVDEPPWTREQFCEVQCQFTELQGRLVGLVSS